MIATTYAGDPVGAVDDFDAEPDAPRAGYCGWGGLPRCRRRIGRRRLCDEHAALLRGIAETWQPSRPKQIVPRRPPGPPRPKPQTIDPADVFDADGRDRVPAVERAQHMARWVTRINQPVTRADAARVAGVEPLNGSARAVLKLAEERGWIARTPDRAVMAGKVAP